MSTEWIKNKAILKPWKKVASMRHRINCLCKRELTKYQWAASSSWSLLFFLNS